jgi:glycosyltransferase involved in cell wall biosynthesis
MKLCILIPAYNCAHILPEVVGRIQLPNDEDEIIIIDDSSQDETFGVANNLPRVYALRNKTNLGYGGTSQRLYQVAFERGADFAINLHGDLGHRPEDIGRLISPLVNDDYDIVVGSRLLFVMEKIKKHRLSRVLNSPELRGNMPLVRVLGHIGLTWLQNMCYKTHLHSFHEGMRGCSRTTIQWLLEKEFSTWYNYDTELLVQANSYGLRIKEVVVPPFYDGHAKSSAPPIRYGIQSAYNAIKACIKPNLGEEEF